MQGTDSAETQEQAEPAAEQAGTGGYDDVRTASRSEARIENGKVALTLPDGVTQEMLGERTAEMIAVQVMLDRSAHAPGVIDGRGGGNTDSAIRYYREAHGLGGGSAVDEALLQSLLDDQTGDIFRTYTVTEADAKGAFRDMPAEFAQMAEMDKLGYETALEMLAERFHMDQDFLRALNPDADFGKAGTKLVIVSHGDGKIAGDVARIEVRKGDDRLVAFDDADEIVATYPATIGSTRFPSPSGSMEVTAIAPEPNYTFQGDAQEWGPEGTYILPPGPNNPVGGTWIDLTKEGYGIHGSPDPALIAKSASHGCVRLTNWNAAALAKAVTQGVAVVFA
ncbi:L,D-transpeptidase [Citromicrobium bathyomarinum]|uniref:L,D-transpeptidase family protein n=1 Tax=Citromicrobium bathyomarinum TaxID=72174 RepID=UPI00315A3AAD